MRSLDIQERFNHFRNFNLTFRIRRKYVELFRIKKSKFAAKNAYNVKTSKDMISTILKSDAPALFSRFGTTEAELCLAINKGEATPPIPEFSTKVENLWRLSGVFPKTIEAIFEFFEVYSLAAREIDFCGVRNSSLEFSYWKLEEQMQIQFSPQSEIIDIEALSPSYDSSDWTVALMGKKVLLVHPFEKTLQTQLEKIRLSPEKFPWLPECEFLVLRAPQTLSADFPPDAGKSWLKVLRELESQVANLDFDIALIGCGAYGLPLGAAIKTMGRKAVHVGGALQLFFAIKGRRWEEEILSTIPKEHMDVWSWPEADDVPDSAYDVEGGAYWGPKL
jgi:hypothetical protein